jgi:hypothetical protein
MKGGLQDIEMSSAIGLRALLYFAFARWRAFPMQVNQRGALILRLKEG